MTASHHARGRPRRYSIAALASAVATTLLLSLAGQAGAACPNEAIRASQTSEQLPEGTVGLPACMALEMVSPARKAVQPAFSQLFSRSGDRVLFKSTAALGNTPGLQFGLGDYYVSSRGAGGWGTSATSAPSEVQLATGSNSGGPYAFSGEMDRWLLYGGTQAQGQVAALQFFEKGIDGSFLPLSGHLVPNDDSGRPTLSTDLIESRWTGTSRDLTTTLYTPKAASTTFLPGDPGEGTAAGTLPGGGQNEYVVSREPGGATSLELLARDKDGTVHGGFCGTLLTGGVGGNQFGPGRIDQGAISSDGSRIYFSTRPDQPGEVAGVWPPCDTGNPLRIMVREETPEGPVIEELVPGEESEPSDFYQGASEDGSKVFFTTTRQLVADDTDTGAECSAEPDLSEGCDLYLYDANLPEGERLIEVSDGDEANVLSSITAVSNDGSHAYFAAEGVLAANANPEGAVAIDGEPNLYLYDEGVLSFIGILSIEDEDVLWGVERSFAGGAYAVPLGEGTEGGDGHILMLASSAPLTATDTDGGKRDIFHYDADAQTLQCVSCAEIAEPGETADVSVNPYEGNFPAPNFTEPGRWVSEDGETVAFATNEPLIEGDDDEAVNPYLWAEGQLARLPATLQGAGAELPAVSAAGNGVAFFTDRALLSAFDTDTAPDIYVLRANGGFPNPTPPSVCDPLSEGACQGPPTTAPAAPAAATSTFLGPGNQKSASRCAKPRVRRKGRCVKPRKRPAKRRASRDEQGGRK